MSAAPVPMNQDDFLTEGAVRGALEGATLALKVWRRAVRDSASSPVYLLDHDPRLPALEAHMRARFAELGAMVASWVEQGYALSFAPTLPPVPASMPASMPAPTPIAGAPEGRVDAPTAAAASAARACEAASTDDAARGAASSVDAASHAPLAHPALSPALSPAPRSELQVQAAATPPAVTQARAVTRPLTPAPAPAHAKQDPPPSRRAPTPPQAAPAPEVTSPPPHAPEPTPRAASKAADARESLIVEDPARLAQALQAKLSGGDHWAREEAQAEQQLVALTAPQRASLEALSALLSRFGSPPAKLSQRGDVLSELGQLRLALAPSQLTAYRARLTKGHCQLWLSYLVARARLVREAPEATRASVGVDESVQKLFAQLMRADLLSHSGKVYGLALEHKPRHGHTWRADATLLRDKLRALLDKLPTAKPEQAAKPQKQPKQPKPAKVAEATPVAPAEAAGLSVADAAPRETAPEAVPADWPHWGTIRERRVVIVGGDKRGDAMRHLQRAFKPTSLEWLELDRTRSPRRVQSFVQRLESGRVELVIFLKRYADHSAGNVIVAACKRHNVPCAFVEQGYGATRVMMAIDRMIEGFDPERR